MRNEQPIRISWREILYDSGLQPGIFLSNDNTLYSIPNNNNVGF